MKIAYLEIYPRLAITSNFELGVARVDGLQYGSAAYGLMLLGGFSDNEYCLMDSRPNSA